MEHGGYTFTPSRDMKKVKVSKGTYSRYFPANEEVHRFHRVHRLWAIEINNGVRIEVCLQG